MPRRAATPSPLDHVRSDAPFVAIDFETADNGRDSACAVGLVRVEDGVVVATHQTLLRPPRRTFTNTRVHGIRWADVANAPTLGEAWGPIASLLDGAGYLAAHNAPFDRSVLQQSCAVTGVAPPTLPFVCTVQVARRVWSLPSNRLPDVCRHLGIGLNHHDALSDATACARIVLAARRTAREAALD